jgi:hypothetical protein
MDNYSGRTYAFAELTEQGDRPTPETTGRQPHLSLVALSGVRIDGRSGRTPTTLLDRTLLVVFQQDTKQELQPIEDKRRSDAYSGDGGVSEPHCATTNAVC